MRRRMSNWPGRIAFTVLAVLISLSTVFLKQHSAVDVIAAVPVCAVGYGLAFARAPVPVKPAPAKRRRRKRIEHSA